MVADISARTQGHAHPHDASNPAGRFDLDGGHLALDFANTLQGRYDELPDDLLRHYTDLLMFARESGQIDAAASDRLRTLAETHPEQAAQAHAAASALREAIFAIFSSLAAEQSPPTGPLATLNASLASSLPHGRVARDITNDRWLWVWDEAHDDLARPIWPIAREAAELLLHGPLDRLRECAAHDCGWLFIDTTRNRARRWCSMQTCGNRAKVQQYRARAAGQRQ
jgi:predicted RNA-binding Zn ribbon-like protein